MLVYAIRHAESKANDGSESGLNAGLSSLGLRQAESLARRFAQLPISAIYTSPLRRCLETAAPLAASSDSSVRLRSELWEYHNLPPDSAKRLEMPSMDDLRREFPQLGPCPDAVSPLNWPVLQEPFADLLARVRLFASYLKGRWTGLKDNVVVISHGTPIARLIEAWISDLAGPSFRFLIDNSSVTALRFSGGVSSLVCLNECSHLIGLPAPAAANYVPGGSIKPEPPAVYW